MHAYYMLYFSSIISKFPSIVLRLIVGLYGVKQYLQCWQLATSRPFYSLSFFRFGIFLPRIWYNMTYTLPALCTETNFRPESKTSWERMREMERRSNSMHSLYLIFHCSRSIPLSLFSFVCVCFFIASFLLFVFVCFVLFCDYFYLFFIFFPRVKKS